MQINVRTQDTVQIIQFVGEIDSNTAPDAQAALMGLMQPGAKIVLDMSQVAFMSSAGLRLLLLTYRTIKGNGGEVVLAGLSDDLKDTMEMTGFLDFFTHADNVDAALAALA
jgi:anti-sigma B factor antagonist